MTDQEETKKYRSHIITGVVSLVVVVVGGALVYKITVERPFLEYDVIESETIDRTSPKGYIDGIRFQCKHPGQCVVTNDYRQSIVRLSSMPISFFQLREWLTSLGYYSTAKDITWSTDEKETT